MSVVKIVFSVLTIGGIAGLTVGGATNVEVTALVPIGVGLGTGLAAIFAILKKK